MSFGVEKLKWHIVCDGEKNFEDTFIRFDKITERDRRTHTQTCPHAHRLQTLHDDIGCAGIASRKIMSGKNYERMDMRKQLFYALHNFKA